ncbi:MAG: ATP-binding protein [Candidatus Nitrosopolaris sp.]|jgi:MoxR-like ATPase
MILNLFRKEIGFENIQGYDEIKHIVRRALDAEDNYNLLFIGPPASAKTLFLLGILESREGVYFDGSNTTNRILDILKEKRPKIICIDELDKMPRQFQDKMLNFMESGHIKVDQIRKQYDFKIKGTKVFAACNEITRLSRPLQSRFRRLHLPPYTEEQFLEVSTKVLPKLKIAHVIGQAVWDQRGDIRDVISIGKLVRKNDGHEEVEQMLSTMIKYGEMKEY